MNENLFDKILSILDNNRGRCCDNDDDALALTEALVLGLSACYTLTPKDKQ